MSNISNVYYEEIDKSVCSMMSAGEFYYHYNLMSIDPMFVSGYEEYEMNQVSIRNSIIGNAIKRKDLPHQPRMNTTIFGVSAVKNKAVIVTEY